MIDYKHDPNVGETDNNLRFYDGPESPDAKLSVVTADWLNSVNTELKDLVKMFGLPKGTDPLEGQLAKFLRQFWEREEQTVGSVMALAYEPGHLPDGSFGIKGYLPCDGHSVRQVDYPKLFAKINTLYGKGDDQSGGTTFNVPDFRGMFLRGWYGTSAHSAGRFGAMQEDAGREISGSIGTVFTNKNAPSSGAFNTISSNANENLGITHSGSAETVSSFDFYASRVWGNDHMANEFRPVNYPVFYCVKHGEVE